MRLRAFIFVVSVVSLLSWSACDPMDAGATGGGAAGGGASTTNGGGSAGGGASGGGVSEGGGAAGGGAEGGGAAGGGSMGGGSAGGGSAGGGSAGGGSAGGGAAGGGSAGGGSAKPDAGQPDGGRDFSTDRAKFFGVSRCAASGVQLCDDFENAALDTATWTMSGGGISVGTAEHARGARALHIQRTGNGASFITEKKTFPAMNNTYFGRMFVKFVAMPTATTGYSHWTIVAATGTTIAGEIRVGGQRLNNGKQLFGVGTDNRVQDAGTGDWTTSDNDPAGNPRNVPLNEWLCLEWMHDGEHEETAFYWDGAEHLSLHTTRTKHGGTQTTPYVLPDFNTLKLGWAEYQATTEPFELWIDEVAIDSKRIGCVL